MHNCTTSWATMMEVMQRMRGGRTAVWVALAGMWLAGCADDEAVVGSSHGCGAEAPVVAFDHETTEADRGIGGGVPEVSVLSADGDIEMVTGSWVASQAAFSPDGEHLVVVKADGDYESAGPDSTALWVMRTDGSESRELTRGDVLDEDPDWSADGTSIVFVRVGYDGERSTWSIATVPAEGGGPAELFRVREDSDSLDQPVWSPDGQRIAFVRSVYTESGDDVVTTVWTMAADGSGAQPLVELPYVASIEWHPDGSTLLVDSDSQEQETYLVDTGTGESELLASGPDLATWAPDGESAYYFRNVGSPEDIDWSIVEGHVVDGDLVDDRTVLAGDDLDDTVLADVGFSPGFTLAVGPCA
jgi:Tol biopolymer transport system component